MEYEEVAYPANDKATLPFWHIKNKNGKWFYTMKEKDWKLSDSVTIKNDLPYYADLADPHPCKVVDDKLVLLPFDGLCYPMKPEYLKDHPDFSNPERLFYIEDGTTYQWCEEWALGEKSMGTSHKMYIYHDIWPDFSNPIPFKWEGKKMVLLKEKEVEFSIVTAYPVKKDKSMYPDRIYFVKDGNWYTLVPSQNHCLSTGSFQVGPDGFPSCADQSKPFQAKIYKNPWKIEKLEEISSEPSSSWPKKIKAWKHKDTIGTKADDKNWYFQNEKGEWRYWVKGYKKSEESIMEGNLPKYVDFDTPFYWVLLNQDGTLDVSTAHEGKSTANPTPPIPLTLAAPKLRPGEFRTTNNAGFEIIEVGQHNISMQIKPYYGWARKDIEELIQVLQIIHAADWSSSST